MRVLLVALVLPWLALAQDGANRMPPAKSDPSPTLSEQVNELVKELGSDDFAKRESAQKALASLGEPALELMRAVLKDNKDPEVATRLSNVISQIETAAKTNKEIEKKLDLAREKLADLQKLVEGLEKQLKETNKNDPAQKEQEVEKLLSKLVESTSRLLSEVNPKARKYDLIGSQLIGSSSWGGDGSVIKSDLNGSSSWGGDGSVIKSDLNGSSSWGGDEAVLRDAALSEILEKERKEEKKAPQSPPPPSKK